MPVHVLSGHREGEDTAETDTNDRNVAMQLITGDLAQG